MDVPTSNWSHQKWQYSTTVDWMPDKTEDIVVMVTSLPFQSYQLVNNLITLFCQAILKLSHPGIVMACNMCRVD